MNRILIVEDEPRLSQLMADYLQHAHFHTEQTDSARQAMALAKKEHFQAILLDLMLPDGDGMEVCKAIRQHSQVPILMVTARVDEVDRLLGLELGADDYICKPFSPREVVARVKAVLRRANPQQDSSTPTLTLDEERYEAVMGSQRVALTAIEFALLATLARHPGRIWSRDQLMDEIYQDHRVVSDRTIDSHIRKLRRKLSDGDDASHDWIGSVYGVGYRLEQP
ncbi:two-component system, OmpR family, response regulator BaeR [Alcanivorax sp. DSM 26293]|uniref:response regulator n=1 Tax=unclassified Alcanivorax TaxID=2638842 RepID=UPI000789C5F9|nr:MULTISPECIES: response regulator [unclassified Alcanivorax]MEE2604314.1 response regulator [Pseudomonadota bacterium]SEF48651.1 two-component system, OmpR family, response regulator BaeR [Alcanivorax sp. DSM 26293]